MNVSESNNFFRESFRGFNKDDVAEYIAKLSRDYTANEEKYKEHIARLTAELKAKNEETTNVGELASELNEKDAIISNLQAQLDLANLALKDEPGEKDAQAEQIEAYQQTIDALSKELDELRESESKNGIEELNQLSFQLAEAESEKLYLFGLLKKIILLLGLENAQIGDIEYAKNISDIAPKAVISEQIESALRGLGKAAQKYSEISVEAAELLERNTELEARLDELWAKIAELEAELAELRIVPEEPEAKAVSADEQKMYETITADLGGIIYSAKKTAEDITTKARADASDILAQARFEAESAVDEATAKRDAIIEENKNNLKGLKEKYEFVKKVHADMAQKHEEMTKEYTDRLSDIQNTINILHDSLGEEHFRNN